jgi:hypothetical protein
MRMILRLLGLLTLAAGTLFTLQGFGIVQWPPDSFMLGKQAWVTNGLIIGAVGLGLVLFSFRTFRR